MLPQEAGVYLLGAQHARGKVERFVEATLRSGAAACLRADDVAAQVFAPQPRRSRTDDAAAAAAAVHVALLARRAALADMQHAHAMR